MQAWRTGRHTARRAVACVAAVSEALRGPGLTAIVALAVAAPAIAESTLTGRITQSGVYDSSPRLAQSETDSVVAYILEPQVSLDSVTERWDVGNTLRLTFPFYDNDDFNLTEQRYDLNATRALPRGNFNILGTLERGSTLTNGLIDELGGLINDNNELVATRRNSAFLRPQWTRQLSERNELVIGASASVVDFEDRTFQEVLDDGRIFDVDIPGQLTGYTFNSVDITLQRAVSERTNVFVTAAVSRFETDDRLLCARDRMTGQCIISEASTITEQSTSNFSQQAQVGVTHAFSETLSGTFRAGGRLVDSDTDTTDVVLGTPTQRVSDESGGGVFDAQLTWAPERTQVTLAASRTLAPSGIGQLLEQDRVSVFVRRDLSPSLTGTLRAGYVQRAQFVGGEPFEREVYRIDPTLRWRMRAHWTLVGGARLAWVRDVDDSERDGVRVFVNLIYEFSRSPVFR